MKKLLCFSLLLTALYVQPFSISDRSMLETAYKTNAREYRALKNKFAGDQQAAAFIARLEGKSSSPAPREARHINMPADRSMNATELATKIIGEAFEQLLKVNPQAAKDLSIRMYITAHPETASSDNAKSNALGHLGKQKKAKRKR